MSTSQQYIPTKGEISQSPAFVGVGDELIIRADVWTTRRIAASSDSPGTGESLTLSLDGDNRTYRTSVEQL